MSAYGIVFVHGGKHDSRYWQPTMDAIAEREPSVHLLAVDLPGRRGVTGDMTLSGCVNSAVAQVQQADMGSIVLDGHSLAGVTMPGIASKLTSSGYRPATDRSTYMLTN